VKCINIVIGNDNYDNNQIRTGVLTMGRGWESDTKRKILNLLPSDGSKMRSKDVYVKGREKNHGYETVEKYLEILEEEGSVNKTIENAKSVWYNRCEAARLKRLIDDFMGDLKRELSALPVRMTDFEKRLIEGSRPGSEIEKGIEFLRNDPAYLRGLIIDILQRELFKMLNDSIPAILKDKYCYDLRLVPRRDANGRQNE
jgi:hypothetical protein